MSRVLSGFGGFKSFTNDDVIDFKNKINYDVSETIVSGSGMIEYSIKEPYDLIDGLIKNINPIIFLPSPFELGLELNLRTPIWFVNTPTPTWTMGEPDPSEKIEYVDRNGITSGTITISPPQTVQLTSYTLYYIASNENLTTGGGEIHINDGGKLRNYYQLIEYN